MSEENSNEVTYNDMPDGREYMKRIMKIWRKALERDRELRKNADYRTLRTLGYRRREIPVRTLLSGAKEGASNIMVDFKHLPKREFIRRYGKEVYDNLLGFTPAQAGYAIATVAKGSAKVAKGTAKVGSALLLNARQEGLRQTPTGSATSTTVPQSVVQAPPAPPSEPVEETQAQIDEKRLLKNSIISNEARPDNLLILQALKAYIDALPQEMEIDSAYPSSSALKLRQVNGVDVLIARALERLSGGSKKKRDRIMELLETEKYGVLWGYLSFMKDNEEYGRIITAATNPLAHELLGVAQSSELEWEPEDSEIELRQLVSGDMMATANRLEALLAESPPPTPVCVNCGFVQCMCQKAIESPSTPVARVKQHLRRSHDLVIVPETDEERAEVGDESYDESD